MTSFGVVAAFLGLGAAISFAQSMRLGYSGSVGRAGGLLYLPALVLCLALLALSFGWWTVGIFVTVALLVGVLNGLVVRGAGGRSSLLLMQPLLVMLFVAGTAVGWVLRYV